MTPTPLDYDTLREAGKTLKDIRDRWYRRHQSSYEEGYGDGLDRACDTLTALQMSPRCAVPAQLRPTPAIPEGWTFKVQVRSGNITHIFTHQATPSRAGDAQAALQWSGDLQKNFKEET